MKIATWNVNSLKVRLPHVLRWLAAQSPDVMLLQETKMTDDAFPVVAMEKAGYHVICSGQKTYNGVAVLSRQAATDAVTDVPGLEDPQRRVLGVTIGDLRIFDLYVPNGQAVGSDKYTYKLDWLQRVREYLAGQLAEHDRLVVAGDLNIAPEDRDVHDPAAWTNEVLCSPLEREAFQQLLSTGLMDAFRLFPQEPSSWSWWDYRMGAFRRDMGLRIDHILISSPLERLCTSCRIDREPRGWERPSDHAPVIVEFGL